MTIKIHWAFMMLVSWLAGTGAAVLYDLNYHYVHPHQEIFMIIAHTVAVSLAIGAGVAGVIGGIFALARAID